MPPPRDDDYIREALGRIERQLEEFNHLLHGNGKRGLKGDVSILLEEREGRTWFTRVIVGGLVTATLMATTTAGCAVARMSSRLDQIEAKGK